MATRTQLRLLREMAAQGLTKAAAARAINRSKSHVGRLAKKHAIAFTQHQPDYVALGKLGGRANARSPIARPLRGQEGALARWARVRHLEYLRGALIDLLVARLFQEINKL